MGGMETVLSIKDLSVVYGSEDGDVKAVNHVSFELKKGKTIGLVGETGAGKTTIALAVMGLLPEPPARVVSGEILYNGKDLLKMSGKERVKLRGSSLSMIFQDPMTSLNPIETVGSQIEEVLLNHHKLSRAEARMQAIEKLEMVGIPGERFDEYPHQFSGGMKQRIVIAIALAANPDLLIADEPTTALDVTIQAQILQLINKLKKEKNTSNIMITHDLGVIAMMCDEVAVVYAGSIIEKGTLEQIFRNPAHPYTIGLFKALPDINDESKRSLVPIKGLMPDPTKLPEGCAFAPRCQKCGKACTQKPVELKDIGEGHLVRCLFPCEG
jgi:peptide/nickel transport system ATP-binding protein